MKVEMPKSKDAVKVKGPGAASSDSALLKKKKVKKKKSGQTSCSTYEVAKNMTVTNRKIRRRRLLLSKKRQGAEAKKTVLSLPNILVTGTPGVGKSKVCEEVASSSPDPLRIFNIGAFAKQHDCFGDWDPLYECHELEEDKVLDLLEDDISGEKNGVTGGVVVDHHGVDFFPERWFHAVFVLRTCTECHYDRLKERSYPAKKMEDNIQCEIFGTIREEAYECYSHDVVHELQNDTMEDLASNVTAILDWIKRWKEDTISAETTTQ